MLPLRKFKSILAVVLFGTLVITLYSAYSVYEDRFAKQMASQEGAESVESSKSVEKPDVQEITKESEKHQAELFGEGKEEPKQESKEESKQESKEQPKNKPDTHEPVPPSSVDWSHYAYAQYVTNALYLCNSVMLFEGLHRHGCQADKLLLYPARWDDEAFVKHGQDQLAAKRMKLSSEKEEAGVKEAEEKVGVEQEEKEKEKEHKEETEHKGEPEHKEETEHKNKLEHKEETEVKNEKEKRARFEGSYDDLKIAGHVLEMLDLVSSKYNVKLKPVEVIHVESEQETWAESFSKFLIFNQTEYKRVQFMDSDGTVTKNMDKWFFAPSARVAATRAYWLEPDRKDGEKEWKEGDDRGSLVLNAQWELVEPSQQVFTNITEYLKTMGSGSKTEEVPQVGAVNRRSVIEPRDSKNNEYDMDIFNKLFKSDALILPFREIMMLSGELRKDPGGHNNFLGDSGVWDAEHVMASVAYIHFSDWPFPKPWFLPAAGEAAELQPKCHKTDKGQSCVEQEIWNKLYSDFAERRKTICQVPMLTTDEGKLVFSEPLAWE